MLGKFIVCPHCSETLELDATERSQEFFTCPSCGHQADRAEEARDTDEAQGPWRRLQQWQTDVSSRAPEWLRPTVTYLFYLAYIVVFRVALFVIFGILGQEVTFRMGSKTSAGLAVAGLIISLLYGVMRNWLSQYPKAKPWIIGLVSSSVVWSVTQFQSPAPSVFVDPEQAQEFLLIVLGFGILFGFVLWLLEFQARRGH